MKSPSNITDIFGKQPFGYLYEGQDVQSMLGCSRMDRATTDVHTDGHSFRVLKLAHYNVAIKLPTYDFYTVQRVMLEICLENTQVTDHNVHLLARQMANLAFKCYPDFPVPKDMLARIHAFVQGYRAHAMR